MKRNLIFFSLCASLVLGNYLNIGQASAASEERVCFTPKSGFGEELGFSYHPVGYNESLFELTRSYGIEQARAIYSMMEKGVIRGGACGLRLEDNVTRAELVTMIGRYFGLVREDAREIIDWSNIDIPRYSKYYYVAFANTPFPLPYNSTKNEHNYNQTVSAEEFYTWIENVIGIYDNDLDESRNIDIHELRKELEISTVKGPLDRLEIIKLLTYIDKINSNSNFQVSFSNKAPTVSQMTEIYRNKKVFY